MRLIVKISNALKYNFLAFYDPNEQTALMPLDIVEQPKGNMEDIEEMKAELEKLRGVVAALKLILNNSGNIILLSGLIYSVYILLHNLTVVLLHIPLT